MTADSGEVVRSTANPRVKALARLTEAPEAMLLEGLRLVRDALEAGCRPLAAIVAAERTGDPQVAEIVRRLTVRGVTPLLGEARVVARLSDAQADQGVLVWAERPASALVSLLPRPWALVLVGDGVQDPGNAGALVRAADAFAALAVALVGPSADPFRPKALRAAMASTFHLPVLRDPSRKLIAELKGRGFRLVAARAGDAVPVWQVDFRLPTALVVGSEGHGLSEAVERLADAFVAIPMPGRAESLNVAAAASVLLYEARRQEALSRA